MAPLDSSPGPRTQAPLQTEVRRHLWGSGASQCCQKERGAGEQVGIPRTNRGSPVVVEYLRKHSGMPVEEVLVQDGVSQIIPKRCFGEQLFQINLLNVRKGSGHVLE